MAVEAVEAVLVSMAGSVLGLAVAGLTLVPLSEAVLGSPMPDGPLWICIAVVGAAGALTLATTLLSAAVVLHNRPGGVVGMRE
ncbi:hypothetical protein [Streptomyces sp. NPDC015125]|uniref:hypothetical protein n=1 Tax=Streptomyces sp. NPDC015125 TaxID=3364938 RepID=UPI0036FB4DB2